MCTFTCMGMCFTVDFSLNCTLQAGSHHDYSRQVTSVSSGPGPGAGPSVCVWHVIYGTKASLAESDHNSVRGTKQVLLLWLRPRFPMGAGARVPPFLVTASNTGRGDGGADTSPPRGRPRKGKPGAGPQGEENSERGRGPRGFGVLRGGGSPMAVT